MKNDKKVSKYLTDAKVGPEKQKKLFVVANEHGVIWLSPLRISETAKIGPKTSKILQLYVIRQT